MPDILADIGTLVGDEIKTLDIRVSAAETAIVNLGGQTPPPTGNFTIEPVTWTNLSEINLSGEKLVNGDFSNTTNLADKFTATSNANNCYARQVVSVNGTYVQSIEIKEALASGTSSFMLDQYFSGITGRSRIRIDLNGSSAPSVSTLSYGDVNDVTVANLDDGWYRISLEVTLNTGSAQIRFGALETGDEVFARNASFVANGTTTELLSNNSAFSTGWTLNNTTIAQGSGLSLDDWTVINGTLNQSKLAEGIIKGSGGHVSIQQTLSQNIAQGTDLVIKVTGDDDIKFYPIKSNGQTDTINDFTVLAANGYAEHTTQTVVSGFRISTVNSTRELSSASIFQGEVSGGSVQTFTGGSIEKISGAGAYNAGASSVQKIDGQKDGYVQFQIGHATHSLKIGLVNQDHDFEVDAPWKMNFGGGYIDLSSPWIADHTAFVSGDWFRIRHYSQENEIKFQKRVNIGTVNNTLTVETGAYLKFLTNWTAGSDEYYIGDVVQVSDMSGSYPQFEGYTAERTLGAGAIRGTHYETADYLGQDYVTFYTHPIFSNGDDLYIDTVFHAVGARLNDVQIAYK